MDVDERKELARESGELVKNKAFQAAILALRKQWFNELMVDTNEDRNTRLIAKLRALEAIPQQLQVFVNDQMMAERKKTYG